MTQCENSYALLADIVMRIIIKHCKIMVQILNSISSKNEFSFYILKNSEFQNAGSPFGVRNPAFVFTVMPGLIEYILRNALLCNFLIK